MNDCNSNPTSGCTENSTAVQIKIMDGKIIPLFIDLEAAINALGTAMLDCCEASGEKIDEINSLLETIKANNTDCCNAILGKLGCIDNILTVIKDGGVPCSTTTTTEQVSPFPCLNYLLENVGGEGDVAEFYTVDCNDVIETIELGFGESLTDCFKIAIAQDEYGTETNLGEWTTTTTTAVPTTTTTTCLDCTTTSTTIPPTTTTTTADPDTQKIYWIIGADVAGRCNLTIKDTNGEVLDKDSNANVQSGVLTGCIGVYIIEGSWVSGSGNIVQMRICDTIGSVFYDSSITNADPLATFTTDSMPWWSAPYTVYITNGNTAPPICPGPM